jgi:hypothetical protein
LTTSANTRARTCVPRPRTSKTRARATCATSLSRGLAQELSGLGVSCCARAGSGSGCASQRASGVGTSCFSATPCHQAAICPLSHCLRPLPYAPQHHLVSPGSLPCGDRIRIRDEATGSMASWQCMAWSLCKAGRSHGSGDRDLAMGSVGVGVAMEQTETVPERCSSYPR